MLNHNGAVPALWRRMPAELRRPGGFELTARLLAAANLPVAARVADVGCGSGGTVAYLRQQELKGWGVEPDQELLQAGRDGGNAWLLDGEGTQLPFPDRSLDAVLTECSLSVMPDAVKVLAEFRRVLKPTGKVLISDVYFRQPQGAEMFRRKNPITETAACLAGALTWAEWERLLAAQGYRPMFWEDASSCLKSWVAQMILASDDRECRAEEPGSILATRPGYFLMVAEFAATRRDI
ncbi:MAG TPA: class I SAM-dependent methyltransferase [Patescibacteria group bacterium]|nr:class I SAM-dependent methyltransferase [Patescibacteria group bacterium]